MDIRLVALYTHCRQIYFRLIKISRLSRDQGWTLKNGWLRTIDIYFLVTETFHNNVIYKYLSHPTCPENFIEIHKKLVELRQF